MTTTLPHDEGDLVVPEGWEGHGDRHFRTIAGFTITIQWYSSWKEDAAKWQGWNWEITRGPLHSGLIVAKGGAKVSDLLIDAETAQARAYGWLKEMAKEILASVQTGCAVPKADDSAPRCGDVDGDGDDGNTSTTSEPTTKVRSRPETTVLATCGGRPETALPAAAAPLSPWAFCPNGGEIVDYKLGLCSCGACPTPRPDTVRRNGAS